MNQYYGRIVGVTLQVDEVFQNLFEQVQTVDKCKVKGIFTNFLAQVMLREEVIAGKRKECSRAICRDIIEAFRESLIGVDADCPGAFTGQCQ